MHDAVADFGEVEAKMNETITTEQADLIKLSIDADTEDPLNFTDAPLHLHA